MTIETFSSNKLSEELFKKEYMEWVGILGYSDVPYWIDGELKIELAVNKRLEHASNALQCFNRTQEGNLTYLKEQIAAAADNGRTIVCHEYYGSTWCGTTEYKYKKKEGRWRTTWYGPGDDE